MSKPEEIYKELKPNQFKKRPILLATWPGPASTGIMLTEYLRTQLGTKAFASIDMRLLYTPESLIVKKGKLQGPTLPKSIFYYKLDPDIIIFESDIQLSGKENIFVLHTILQVASHFQVSRIITFDTLPRLESHTSPSVVFSACNSDSLIETFKSFDIEPVKESLINGPTGLLPAIAMTKNIDAACLLVTAPAYAGLHWCPKASLALLKKITHIHKIVIDFKDIEKKVKESEQMFETIEIQFNEQYPGILQQKESVPNNNEITDIFEHQDEIPGHIIVKIEELFKSAEKDKGKVTELKTELVRWELYNKHEKRFLDLFKKNDQGSDNP